MNSLLSKSNVEPGTKYNVADFHNAIKSAIKINPSIHCVREKHHNGEQYLSEIKICFNKQLELVNCNGVLGLPAPHYDDDVITNCDPNNQINYPSTLPQYLLDNNDREPVKPVSWRFPWVNLYKLLQLIKWLTL